MYEFQELSWSQMEDSIPQTPRGLATVVTQQSLKVEPMIAAINDVFNH
jgi:hypothetical protein